MSNYLILNYKQDQEELRQIGKRIVEGLSSDHVIIIQNSPIFSEKVKAALEESKKFLSQSQVIIRFTINK